MTAHEWARALLDMPDKEITLLPLGFDSPNMRLFDEPRVNLGGGVSIYVKPKGYENESKETNQPTDN